MAKKDALTVDPASEVPGVVGQTAGDGPYLGERMPLPVPEGGWPADEFTGMAGSFVRDPFTGIRQPASD